MNSSADQSGLQPYCDPFSQVCVYRLGVGSQLDEDESMRKDNKFYPNYTIFFFSYKYIRYKLCFLLFASRRGQAPSLQ